MLKYHQATFDLLKREPVIDQQAVEQLIALEEKYHITLPASVREWYSLEAALALMDNNDDIPVPIAEFEVIPVKTAPWGLRIENGFLTVMRKRSEFGDVVQWYVRLDGPDDPPVIASE